MRWEKEANYNTYSWAEAAAGGYKQVIGKGMRLRKDSRRDVEVSVCLHFLNRGQELRRPISAASTGVGSAGDCCD